MEYIQQEQYMLMKIYIGDQQRKILSSYINFHQVHLKYIDLFLRTVLKNESPIVVYEIYKASINYLLNLSFSSLLHL